MNRHNVSRRQLAARIDQAFLRPNGTRLDLWEACEDARRYRVALLCVRPSDVVEASSHLAGAGVPVGTVIGFPHGSVVTAVKAAEARRAIADGAAELDMVLHIGRLIEGDISCVRDDIAAVVDAAEGRIVKVILECCYLAPDQMAAGCDAALSARAHFVKTSTGTAPGGARVEDVRFLRAHVGDAAGVKAAGGIRTLNDALAMLEAGADRIGASNIPPILDPLPE